MLRLEKGQRDAEKALTANVESVRHLMNWSSTIDGETKALNGRIQALEQQNQVTNQRREDRRASKKKEKREQEAL